MVLPEKLSLDYGGLRQKRKKRYRGQFVVQKSIVCEIFLVLEGGRWVDRVLPYVKFLENPKQSSQFYGLH